MAIVISGVNNNDKITAADGKIDLLSGVSYASTITAPDFTASNNITAASINVGSNIQLGNAGIVTATTFIGNLTGNVNNTGNLLLQISGSEKFRVGSSGQLGIGGANYGTSGQVLTSGGSGSAATWSTITGTTINNNADNRIITGSGTANTLEGEANLTFNGGASGDAQLTVHAAEANANSDSELILETSNDFATSVIMFKDSTAEAGSVAYNHGDNYIKFSTNGTNGGTERVRIDAGGNMNVTGVVTATAFHGDGSSLTGVSSPTANRNFITNGSMRFWQRGTSFNSQGNGQNDYTADRWAIGHNNSHMAAVTQQDGAGADTKFAYCARIQRDSGQSQTDQMRFHTALETKDVEILRGEVLTISYYARKGANYSEANSKITGVRIATGENTDGDPNAYSGGHWTNATTILTGTPTLTTSWQRFSHTTSAVSNYANSMIIEFRHTPTGTAGANDYYEITGVQLEIGSSMTAFEHRRYPDELLRCQRFYQKDLSQNRRYWGSGNVSDRHFPVRFDVEMRNTPSVSFASYTVDSGSPAASGVNKQGYYFRMTGSGRYYQWQHIADAEL